MDDAYFKDSYRLIAVDLSKQKALDADPRAIQPVVFHGVVGGNYGTKIRLYTILEQSKETVLEFYKGTAKVFWLHINGWIQQSECYIIRCAAEKTENYCQR